MSAIRHLMRATTVAGIALAGTIVAAGPVHAADASCQLVRPPSRLTAGTGQGALIAHVRSSNNREVLPVVQVVWQVRLNGLDADEVSLSGLSLNQVDEQLTATEQLRNVTGIGRTVTHTLRFLTGAPNGRATVTMRALLPERDGEAKEACNSRATITVVGSRGTPTPSEEPTLEPGPADVTPENQQSQTPLAAAVAPPPASDNDAALWPLYVLGLLLVAGGGGLVAMLLLRRPRRNEGGPGPAPAYAASYGGAASYGSAGYSDGGYPAPPGSMYGGAGGVGYGSPGAGYGGGVSGVGYGVRGAVYGSGPAAPSGRDGGTLPAGRDTGGRDGGGLPGGRDGGTLPGGRDGGTLPGGRDGGAPTWPAYGGGAATGYGAQPIGAAQDPWPSAGVHTPFYPPEPPNAPESPTTIMPRVPDEQSGDDDRRPGGWRRDGGQ
jgi:hypothetical protein